MIRCSSLRVAACFFSDTYHFVVSFVLCFPQIALPLHKCKIAYVLPC